MYSFRFILSHSIYYIINLKIPISKTIHFMCKGFILSMTILMIISVADTQAEAEIPNILPQQQKSQFKQQEPISAEPIAIDPIVVNTAPQETDEKTDTVERGTQKQGVEQIKIEPKQNQYTNTQKNQPIETQQNEKIEKPKLIPQKMELETEQKEAKIDIDSIKSRKMERMKKGGQKYEAQRKRLQEWRKKQQAYEEERKKEMEQIGKEEYDAVSKISESEKVRSEQIDKMRKIMENQSDSTTLTTMLFEIDAKIQQYLIRPSVDMNMILRFTVYVENNNVFGLISDITKTQPLKVYVYEGNSRIVGQAQCYYEAVIKFKARANQVYSVRAYNSGGLKLVSFRYPNYLTTETTSKLLSEEKGTNQMQKAKSFLSSIALNMKKLQEARVLDVKNANFLKRSMKRYYSYHIIEIVVFVSVCFIQIFFIKSLFKNQSIL